MEKAFPLSIFPEAFSRYSNRNVLEATSRIKHNYVFLSHKSAFRLVRCASFPCLTMAQAQETYEVQLAIYDLSRGMARNLSNQFLGPQFAIDAIPHTGIVVFGLEYFFGGGIQSEEPALFRRSTGMVPIETRTLGRTTVNKLQFERWCQTMMETGQYNAAAYDLLSRNCNNFSNEAALTALGLPVGVPEWILDVPRRFLSSPMGQMVRPMLENMQLSNVAGAMPVTAAPFAGSAAPVRPRSSTPLATPAASNPWANIPSPSALVTATAATEAKVVKVKGTPILDTFTKPLLSNDAKTVGMCMKKLAATSANETEESLALVTKVLSSGSTLSEDQTDQVCRVILSCLESGSNLVFGLMLLRIVVLHSPAPAPAAAKSCLTWCCQQLTDSTTASTSLQSPAARTMAWVVVSNAHSSCGAPSGFAASSTTDDSLVEAAIADISLEAQPLPQVRQAASTLLYNTVLFMSTSAASESANELSDGLVSMLCACLEGVATEPDPTVKLRRLVVAGRILKSPTGCINGAAKCLVTDLGFQEALDQVAGDSTQPAAGDASQCQKLARELVIILNE
jgi:hypothetical protein